MSEGQEASHASVALGEKVPVNEDDAVLLMRRTVLDEIDLYGVRASTREMAEIIPLVTMRRIRLDPLTSNRFPIKVILHP